MCHSTFKYRRLEFKPNLSSPLNELDKTSRIKVQVFSFNTPLFALHLRFSALEVVFLNANIPRVLFPLLAYESFLNSDFRPSDFAKEICFSIDRVLVAEAPWPAFNDYLSFPASEKATLFSL